jgi:protein involved in polysaccharide export with SLBB domain
VTSASLPEAEYRIQPGDLLDIKFFYSPELNEQMPVRPDGRISLQLAHEIMAAGLTPAELAKALKEKYSEELKKPEVTVIVRTFGSQRIYVDGEVAKPGLVSLSGPTTVFQAISQAGGVKETGNGAEVVVIRGSPGNKPAAVRVNMEAFRSGIDMSQDIFLKPFDIVYVQRSYIANVDRWIDQ